MKTVLLVGSGAREHAIARALKRSSHNVAIICLASHLNPGIAALSTQMRVVSLTNVQAILEEIKDHTIHFAIIGPEAPLEVGLADALIEKGIPCVGPKKVLAQIETSKSFCRELMSKYEPSALPHFKTFSSMEGVSSYTDSLNQQYVIKASGLMGGKGVYVSDEHFHTKEEAADICEMLLSKKQSFLIEEKLVGEEFSLLSFCDGETLVHMPLVQDNKRAYFDDKGPNTGGMGSVSYATHSLPFLTEDELEQARTINQRAIEGLQEECGASYQGILYGGYMLTRHGVKLIEFNARFGDPECINLLGILETDFVDICQAMVETTLDKLDVHFAPYASVCKYVVPHGYPQMPVKNENIQFNVDDETIYSGHVAREDDRLLMLGSRTAAVLGVDEVLERAESKAEEAARTIKGNVFYRNDIGKESLLSKRIERMRAIREETT